MAELSRKQFVRSLLGWVKAAASVSLAGWAACSKKGVPPNSDGGRDLSEAPSSEMTPDFAASYLKLHQS